MTTRVPARAVILAGGLGARLAPYTTVFPKPLMPIDGRPILELVLRRLKMQGVEQVVLAVSYLEELIRAFFGDGRRFGLQVEYFREEQPLGTVGSLSLIKGLPDPTLVLNGDILTTIDVADMVAMHQQNQASMTVATQHREVGIDYGVLDVVDGGRIVGYREKPKLSYSVSAGLNLISHDALSHLRPGERCDIPDLVARLLTAGKTVIGFGGEYYWRDIGRPADYELVNQEFPGIKREFGL